MGATYAQAGVNLTTYNRAIGQIVRMIKGTHNRSVLNLPQGFAGLYSLNGKRSRDPVLVSCCDGVGTKLAVARRVGKHDTIGIDLVAMSVNDLIVTGATPLFFLDCISVGKVSQNVLTQIMKGIVKGCHQSGCALLGGETAEMPGMYGKGEYDVVGFAVGIIDRKNILDGKAIRPGDDIIGIASNGLHSNGYSLVRKILFGNRKESVSRRVPELRGRLGDILLKPTRIYVPSISKALASPAGRKGVHGMAHITGGGLLENIPRVLPKRCAAEIQEGSWSVPPVFPYVQKLGRVAQREMYRVFNMGIGMTMICAPTQTSALLRTLKRAGEKAWRIGWITRGVQEVRLLPPSNKES